MNNPISWFEIATNDLERAKAFYTAVFQREFKPMNVNGEKMYIFEADYSKSGSGGALIKAEDFKPGIGGTMVYFSSEDVGIEAARVEAAGGKLILPKTDLGGPGFIAQFIDTEGNKIGIYSSPKAKKNY